MKINSSFERSPRNGYAGSNKSKQTNNTFDRIKNYWKSKLFWKRFPQNFPGFGSVYVGRSTYTVCSNLWSNNSEIKPSRLRVIFQFPYNYLSDYFFNKQITQLLKFPVVSHSEIFHSVPRHPQDRMCERIYAIKALNTVLYCRWKRLAASRCINICLLHSCSRHPGEKTKHNWLIKNKWECGIVFNNWIIKFTV